MRKLMRNLVRRLPLEFRVLYRQFLLRVVDLESLSIEADIPRFLGQFAGVLIMISLLQALGAFWMEPSPTPAAQLVFAWSKEQSLICDMMLVVGLIAVVSWDSTFPDRRDVMVLSPLPVRPLTILLAKVAASAAIVGYFGPRPEHRLGFCVAADPGGLSRRPAILPGLLVHDGRRQPVPVLRCAHHSGIHRAAAPAPHLSGPFSHPATGRIRSFSGNIFSCANLHESG